MTSYSLTLWALKILNQTYQISREDASDQCRRDLLMKHYYLTLTDLQNFKHFYKKNNNNSKERDTFAVLHHQCIIISE